ncbi:MAG: RDD family protein [Actinotalea sp.]|nr:RDD family protein [Actinotalea sp.]
MGRRLLAAAVDGALALLVVGAPVAVALLTRPADDPAAGGPGAALLAASGVGLLALAVTQWVLLGRRGWTLGKRALSITVLSERSGFPPGLGAAFLRGLVPALSTVVPVIGPALVLASPLLDRSGRRQGWHDRAAGTVVVDAASAPAPDRRAVDRRLGHLLDPPGNGTTGPVPPPAPWPVAPEAPDDALPAVLEDTGRIDRPGTPAEVRLSAGPLLADRPVLPRTRGLVPGTRVVPPSPVPDAVPFQQRPLEEDVEATRLRPARTRVPEMARGHEVTVELTDGQRVTFSGTALVGRNPTPRPGEDGCCLITVADPGRSVSKTHLLLGVDRHGLWVKDRQSTNGTVVTLADGQQILCGAGQQVRLPPGASVAFGDYGLSVATVDAV